MSLKLRGEVVSPAKYLYKIEEGFKDVSLFVADNKQEFLDIALNQEYNIRQVLRATYIYGMYMAASEHPKYLKDEDDYNKVFDVLKFSENDVFTKEIIDIEISILKSRNIPYFYTKLYKNNLYYIDKNGDEQKIENYYLKSLDEVLKEKVNKLSYDKIEHQLRIIRLSFVDEVSESYKSRNRVSYTKDLCEVIEKVIDTIEKYSFGDEKNYMVDLALCNKLYIVLMNYSLYEGGSVLLLLNYYAHFKKNNELKARAYKLLNTIVENYPYAEEEILSAYSGIGSMIYIYYNLYKLWGEEEYKNKFEEVLNILNNGLDKYKYELDYLNGNSSIVFMLSNIYKDCSNPIIEEILLKIVNKLEDMYTDNSVNKTGLAHGYSGVGLAFIAAGHRLKKEKYIELGKRIIEKEDSYYDEKLCNWRDIRTTENKDLVYWCYGVGGITLARYMMLKDIDSNIIKDDLNKGINKLKEIDLSKIENDSMCHGFFGIVDMFNIMNIHDVSELKTMVKARIDKINYNGFEDGFKSDGDIFGGMIGISGMALTILRILCDKYPSILSLGIYRGNDYE
ncbi:type 2 lantibiotic biosynthesis protein LanM [Clostridium sp. DSM 8431]|uniref:type 2 lanthipeptide synthetase LanM n=1 Tax=Clostridium sp. DSM 8431 TaxID=1761781 RepID=UPI0008EB6324|nr:type 2 lanthipeptide synthetase LanM [Clostridium sp. DSM 8431]SFU89289.1 type 2 lantibiotic biosynthesis protein LanM [Clostridium sp. DSM 8431]